MYRPRHAGTYHKCGSAASSAKQQQQHKVRLRSMEGGARNGFADFWHLCFLAGMGTQYPLSWSALSAGDRVRSKLHSAWHQTVLEPYQVAV